VLQTAAATRAAVIEYYSFLETFRTLRGGDWLTMADVLQTAAATRAAVIEYYSFLETFRTLRGGDWLTMADNVQLSTLWGDP